MTSGNRNDSNRSNKIEHIKFNIHRIIRLNQLFFISMKHESKSESENESKSKIK